MVTMYDKQEIIRILSSITDPEIPVVNIRQMGILRDVIVDENGYEIVLTPTYTGCPAMGFINTEIKILLEEKGVGPFKITQVMHPAWTTDWMDDETKERLRTYGIAPPLNSHCNHVPFEANIITCPRCSSQDTVLLSRFGSTACKSLYKCNECKEPFEYFKCH